MANPKQIVQIIELGVAQTQPDHINVSRAIAALAQEGARARVAAAAPAALTDSSTGVAIDVFTLAAVIAPTNGLKDGVAEFAPKAGFDTAIGLVEDAHSELGVKTSALIALIGGSTAADVAAYASAAAVDDTIAAMSKALTGVTSNCVDAVTGKQQIVIARNNQAALASAINWCRTAMGLLPLTDGTGGIFDKAVGVDWASVAQVATGTAVTANGAATLTDVSTDLALDALADNVASMAAALNEMRGTVAIGPFVVATQNAHTRLVVADTTV
jgi:hypothetical protein